jgi:chemotaxis methyl-accepting protein methylase
LALEWSPETAKKQKRKQYWMKEWFKKRVTFSNQNLLQELLVSSQVDYNNFMRMEHLTFLYQRLDSN